MASTPAISKIHQIWHHIFVQTLILMLALRIGINMAITDHVELNVGTLGQIQNVSLQDGFEGNLETFNSNDETTTSKIQGLHQEKQSEPTSRRKLSEDCRLKQAETLQRLQNHMKTGRSSNNHIQPKNYHSLMPRRSDNSTRFSLELLEKSSYFDNEYVPKCTPEGKYVPIQCHKIGYCWCVNKYGQAIKNSASEVNSEPTCDPTLYESDDLESFIVTEAKTSRLKALLRGNLTSLSGVFMDAPMDSNEDELNSSQNPPSEQDDFDRRVQASQEPSLALVPNECILSRDNAKIRASRHSDKDGIWIPECDLDNPNLYAQKQCHKSKVCWCVEQVTGLPLRTNEQLSVRLDLNCTSVRSKTGDDTLISLKQTRQKPSTSSYYQGFSEACDADQRADFMKVIISQFRQQIAEYLKSNPLQGQFSTLNPYSLSDVNISTWKFHLIDTDHNGTLNDREWSRFRNNFKLIDKIEEYQRLNSWGRMSPLRIMRQQRRCWRAFLNYCSGGDILVNSITLKDWTNCTDLPSRDMKTLNHDMALLNAFAHTKEAAIIRSRSRNPFSSLLKPD